MASAALDLSAVVRDSFKQELSKLAAARGVTLTEEALEKAAGFLDKARGALSRAGGALKSFVAGGTSHEGIPMQSLGDQLNPFKGLASRLRQGVSDLRSSRQNLGAVQHAVDGAAQAEHALTANTVRASHAPTVNAFEQSFGLGEGRASRPAIVPPAPDPDVVVSGGRLRSSAAGTANYQHPLLRKVAEALVKSAIGTTLLANAAKARGIPQLGAINQIARKKELFGAPAAREQARSVVDYLRKQPVMPAVAG